MATYKIAVMPGDGTGPEVTAEAVKVIKVAADKFNLCRTAELKSSASSMLFCWGPSGTRTSRREFSKRAFC